MIAFAMLSLPIFGVVVLGWLAMRSRFAGSDAFDALGMFSFRFALPALVFRLIAARPLVQLGLLRRLTGERRSHFCARIRPLALPERQAVATAGARGMATAVSNLGFLGPALMPSFFGERGAGPLGMAILAEIGFCCRSAAR